MGTELFKKSPSKVGDLVRDVRNGRIGLPDLQRPFIWKETSNKVNAFATGSRIPAVSTTYNTLLAVEPSHLIRIAIGVGFRRARFKYAICF